jgi:hypothetical protein
MGLKVATFQYVNQFGAIQNAFMTWLGADINYGTGSDGGGSVRFAVYENAAEAARNNRKDVFVMPVTPAEIMQMFTRQGVVALEVSNASWELAADKKFIYSRVLDEETEELQMIAHSLEDLEATVTDIGIPESFGGGQ